MVVANNIIVFSELPYKVGLRTGNIFPLCEDRKKQFSACVFRGYDGPEGKPKNPFPNETFDHAVARLSKVTKKRKLRGAALGFSKRKKKTEEIESVVNL